MSHISDFVKQIDTATFKILKRALPGPYTFILPGNNSLPKEFKKKTTVGIRIPDNSLALGLLAAFHELGGAGIAAPSANRFGQVSPTTAEAVQEELGNYLSDTDLVLDGGPSVVGVESTIINLTAKPTILNAGTF